ncbi:uncharacterized protein [Antedon mediterranea]|uniref:uncharacterized protein n=1 Tax=Antedon mediterranea TaxID=105859 RepID=UPI003AF57FE7
MGAVEQRRLFIGGLFKGITQNELKERFNRYGEVSSVEIIVRLDEIGEVYKTFGYVDIKADDTNVKKCLNTYNGSKWKGHCLTIQTAKESFQQRLKREKEEVKHKETLEKRSKKTKSAKERLQESFSKAGVKDFDIRNAVPGTEITGEKNWTVTKFGRVVPIVYIRSKTKRKVNKIDPSKYSHSLKRIKDENDSGNDGCSLTWEMEAAENKVQYQKRIGAYSTPIKKKKRKLSQSVYEDESEDDVSKLVPNLTKGNAISYQYEDEKNDDFEVVSVKFDSKNKSKDLTAHNFQQKVTCKVYNSSDDEEEEGDNILLLPKLIQKSKLSSTSKKEQREKLTSTSQKNVSQNENITERTTELKAISSRVDSEKQKGKYFPNALFTPEDISISNSNGTESSSSESTDADTKNDFKLSELQKKKAISTKSEAGESGYDIFATRDPVSVDDLLDEVNLDSSGKFYYKSAVNPLTNQEIDFIVLEPQGTEVKNLISGKTLMKESGKKCQKVGENIKKTEENTKEIKSILCSNEDCSKDEDISAVQPNTLAIKNNTSVSPVTSKKSDVCVQPDQDDTVSVSSADTDEICSRKTVNMFADISLSMSGDVGVVEFYDQNDYSDEQSDDLIKLKEGLRLCGKEANKSNGNSDNEDNSVEETDVELDEDSSGEDANDELLSISVNNVKTVCSKNNEVEKNMSNNEEDSSSSEEAENGEDEDASGDVNVNKSKESASIGEFAKNREDANDDEEPQSEDVSSDDEDVESSEEKASSNIEEKMCGDDDSNGVEDSNGDEDVSGDEDTSDDDEDAKDGDSSSGGSTDGDGNYSSDAELPKVLSSASLNGKHSSNSVQKPKKVLDLSVLKGDPAKQASSNIKRLASMQKKTEVMLGQKRAIQIALAAVDTKAGPAQGKHIKFDSDDEDDDTANITIQDETKPSNIKLSNKGPVLFASDDNDSDEDDDDARFQNKSQFEGKSGEKLRKLQQQAGGDERFSMDKRFLEEDDSDGKEENLNSSTEEDDKNVDSEVDLRTEKEKSYSILQGIVGTKAMLSKQKDVQTDKLGFLGKMIRYDPTRDDHLCYEVKSKEPIPSVDTDKKSAKKKKVDVQETTLPEVSKEKYFEVSGDLTKALKNDQISSDIESSKDNLEDKVLQNQSTFRFFGDSDEEETSIKKNDVMLSQALPKVNPFAPESSKFRFFESSDEEMEEEEAKETIEKKSNDCESTEPRQLFFFQQNDNRLTDGPLQFYRKENIENITRKWQENRSQLMTLSRNRYRKAIRQKKQTARRMKLTF